MRLYLRLLSYAKPYLPQIALAAACTIFAAGTTLCIPIILGKLVDSVLAAKNLIALNAICAGAVILILLQGLLLYGQTYFAAYAGQKVATAIRRELFRHLQRLSLLFFETRQTGSLMSYIINDVTVLQNALIDNTAETIARSIVLTGSIAIMVHIGWKLSLLTFITFPFIILAINISGRRLRIKSGVLQERSAEITAFLQESLLAIKVVKSFARENHALERFDRENSDSFSAQMKTVQVMAAITPTINTLAAIGVTAIIWYGGREAISGPLTAGALATFLACAANLPGPVKRLSRVYGDIRQAAAAARRVFEILDTEPDVNDPPDAAILPPVNGHVQFHNVTFEYKPGKPILSDLSFAARPGQIVALVGAGGAAKTAVANLIPRFYDPGAGHITIDGVNIREVTLYSLRKQIGIVPRETLLFNGTVYENIIYGDLDASPDAVVAAAKAANAHNFIMQMPGDYAAPVGERGAKLSGGQSQRIAIARTILKNPRILILDEAACGLDTSGETLVQQALDKLMAGRTSFVIAHQQSTVQRADLILVIDSGQIIEQGTHAELIKLGGHYRSLYNAQFARNEQQSV